MRRLLNGALVSAVAVLVGLAALDALSAEEDGAEPARVPPVLAGELVWSDPSCRRHAVSLPGLERRDFRTVGCGVFTRRDNLGVKDGEVAWFAYPDPGGSTTLLDRDGLRGQVGRRFRVRAVAWLGGVDYAALLTGPRTLVTTWRRASMGTVTVVEDGFANVRASPDGRWFAVRGRAGVRVFSRDGEPVEVGAARSLAWSPDGRWVALARAGEVAILPAEGGAEVARLPLDAVDLDWRPAE